MEREEDASYVFVSSSYQILAMPVHMLAQPAQGLQFAEVKIGDLWQITR